MIEEATYYRTIGKLRYEKILDLTMSEEENEQAVKDAKLKYRKVRKIKHVNGYFQLFVAIRKG